MALSQMSIQIYQHVASVSIGPVPKVVHSGVSACGLGQCIEGPVLRLVLSGMVTQELDIVYNQVGEVNYYENIKGR